MKGQAKFILIYLTCWLLLSIISLITFSHSDPEFMAHCLWATVIYAAIQSLGWILIIYTTRKFENRRSVSRFVFALIYLNLVVCFVNVDHAGIMPEIYLPPISILNIDVVLFLSVQLLYTITFLVANYFTFGKKAKLKLT